MKRLAVILCLAVLPAAAGSGEEAGTSVAERARSALVRALTDPDRGVRFAAADGLGRLGGFAGPAVGDLASALSDPEWCVRSVAVRALRDLGEPAVPYLAPLLADPRVEMRRVAARALAMMGAHTVLGPAFEDPDEWVRLLAARGEPREADRAGVLDALRSVLGSESRRVRVEACGRLVDLDAAEDAVPVLGRELQTANGREVLDLTEILRRAGPALGGAAGAVVTAICREKIDWRGSLADALVSMGEGAVPAIRDGLQTARGPARRSLEIALDRIGGPPEPPLRVDDPPADPWVPTWEERVADGEPERMDLEAAGEGVSSISPEARRLALRAVVLRGAEFGSLRPAVAAALGDPAPEIRALALRALRALAPDDPATAAAGLAGLADADPVVREVAVDLLVATGAPVEAELAGRDRLLALRVLAGRGARARAALPTVLDALSEPSFEVRGAAARAVGEIAGDDPAAARALGALLADPSPSVRVRVALALGRLGASAVAPLGRALADPNWRVRALAARSLGGLGPAAGAAAADLAARLADEALEVGIRAADALIRIGPAAARPTAGEMATGRYDALTHGATVFRSLGADGASATAVLAAMLEDADVNVREVAAAALGDIGPGAAAAVPGLVRALADRRIPVRSRASVALGQIGAPAVTALLAAADSPDARVRASAIFALGYAAGTECGFDQVPYEMRLPVAEPGPAEDSGFVPTPAQAARAATLVGAGGGRGFPAWERLEDLPRDEAADVLRAGLRSSDLAVARVCAAALGGREMDAWESERAVELLLPDCFAPDPPAGFDDIYEYLGSSEVPATLNYAALADPSAVDSKSLGGPLHRITRWDGLPEFYRLARSADAWIVDGEVWFADWWSGRYEELAGAAALKTPYGRPPEWDGHGLSPGLRAILEQGFPTATDIRAWLNDSTPAPEDVPFLLVCAEDAAASAGRDMNWDLHVLLRALGSATDGATARFLRRFFADDDEDGWYAGSALAGRGDPDTIRMLVEGADEDWLPLALLLEVRPELGREVLLGQLLTGTPDAPAFELAGNFENAHWLGPRWAPETFLGLGEAALAAEPGVRRLSWIVKCLPDAWSAESARAILAGLAAEGPVVVTEPEPEEYDGAIRFHDGADLLALVFAVEPDGFRTLMRKWSRSEDPAARDWALRKLLTIGDPESAPQLVEWARAGGIADGWQYYPCRILARSPAPETEAFLRERIASGEEEDEEGWLEGLAELHGLPESDVGLPYRPDDPSPAWDRLKEGILVGTPVEALIAYFREEYGGSEPLALVADLKTDAARALLGELRSRRGTYSCPALTGFLARAGDPEARADAWSAFRAGRYRWICYENESEASLTLGWDRQTYPGLLEHLGSNCCRGGHVARMFETMMGSDTLNYQPHGQEGCPERNAAKWIALYGGAFAPTPFETGGTAPEWLRAIER